MKTLPQMVADAGYFYGIDIDGLAAAVQRHPGCADIKPRSIRNVVYGIVSIPPHVALALSAVLGVPVEDVLRAVTR